MKTKLTVALLNMLVVLLVFCTLHSPLSIWAQGTAFTYQGRLNHSASPANGSYDLRFRLASDAFGNNYLGSPVLLNGQPVSNGLFTVRLDFGAGMVTGSDRWMQVDVRTNGAGSYTTLTPLQALTPTPYAIMANSASNLLGTLPAAQLSGTLPSSQLSGTYSGAVTFNNAANQFAGNGAGLSNVNALTLGGLSVSSFWQLGGNAGTAPGIQFVGTTDNLPMDFKVNGARALRLEPNPNAPNVIGGSAANEVTNGIYGAVIAGGGSSFYPNRVGGIFGTVVGGAGNTASGNSATAMGQFTTASGYAASAMGWYAEANGFGSLAAGSLAKANHDGSFVWADNTFADFTSTAAKQFLIRAAGGVGINNNNPNGAALAVNGNVTVNNTIGTPGNQPLELKVNNQRALRLEPTVNDLDHSNIVNVIGGSSGNFVAPGYVGATIGGGGAINYFGQAFTNLVSGDFGTVGGGIGNTSSGSFFAMVGGGYDNTSSADYATVGGGYGNTSSGEGATVGGGLGNTASGQHGTVAGGGQNMSSDHAATVGGGEGNTSSGFGATVPGGFQNLAEGGASFAAGNRAKALHHGAFVWADSQGADFNSTADNQFLIRASGGVGIGVTSPQQPLSVATGMNIDQNDVNAGTVANTLRFGSGSGESIGSKRTPGGNRWGLDFYTASVHRMTILNTGQVGIGTPAPSEKLHVLGNILASGTITGSSDRNVKTNFSSFDTREVLAKVAALPLSRWSYTNDIHTVHIGPMAQDFHSAFNVGSDDKHISMVDADGVALAAIQGLNQKLEETRKIVAQKDAELQSLKQTVAELKARFDQLATH